MARSQTERRARRGRRSADRRPQSPYADRLVLVQAEAEEALGHPDRAIAACETLLADYPGSPLRDAAKEKIAALKTAATKTERTGERKATKEDLKEARGSAGSPDSGTGPVKG